MGTHMWNSHSQPLHKGRRLSLELSLPPPLPQPGVVEAHEKDSVELHSKPDLFFPYLPTPLSTAVTAFITNGVACNEVGSVVILINTIS